LQVQIAGEELLVDAQRALLWPAERTMFLADLHLGKSDQFRRAGIPIPEGNTASDLQRIEQLVEQYQVRRVVLLGDFLHSRSSATAVYTQLFAAWRESRPHLDFIVVAGNHDRFDAFKSGAWNVQWQRAGAQIGPFVCQHHPGPSPQGFVLAGHVHPVMFLYGSGRERLRLPVLWLRDQYAVLPSFGSFTGGAEISPSDSDTVFAFAADRVWRVPGPSLAMP
jgi:uncharacterized protein